MLAMPDRAADGQFSCDTGLSRPVPLIECDRSRVRRLLGDGFFECRCSSLWPPSGGQERRALIMRAIKCLKGVRWMPWHAQAMKDVVRCDKPWGAANEL
jgi:hypothetical protein